MLSTAVYHTPAQQKWSNPAGPLSAGWHDSILANTNQKQPSKLSQNYPLSDVTLSSKWSFFSFSNSVMSERSLWHVSSLSLVNSLFFSLISNSTAQQVIYIVLKELTYAAIYNISPLHFSEWANCFAIAILSSMFKTDGKNFFIIITSVARWSTTDCSTRTY